MRGVLEYSSSPLRVCLLGECLLIRLNRLNADQKSVEKSTNGNLKLCF